MKKLLCELYESADEAAARAKLCQIQERYAQKVSRAVTVLEAAFDDATAVLALPEPLRKRLRTTNMASRSRTCIGLGSLPPLIQ